MMRIPWGQLSLLNISAVTTSTNLSTIILILNVAAKILPTIQTVDSPATGSLRLKGLIDMKRWFITVICRYGLGDHASYLCVNARTKQSAIKKALKCFDTVHYSLVAVDIVNVVPADSINKKALRAQKAQAERAIADAEKFLQIEKRRYEDLRCQLYKLEDERID